MLFIFPPLFREMVQFWLDGLKPPTSFSRKPCQYILRCHDLLIHIHLQIRWNCLFFADRWPHTAKNERCELFFSTLAFVHFLGGFWLFRTFGKWSTVTSDWIFSNGLKNHHLPSLKQTVCIEDPCSEDEISCGALLFSRAMLVSGNVRSIPWGCRPLMFFRVFKKSLTSWKHQCAEAAPLQVGCL